MQITSLNNPNNLIPKSILDKWITALRSGEYKQGHGQLTRIMIDESGEPVERFDCCLGVLATVMELPIKDYPNYGSACSSTTRAYMWPQIGFAPVESSGLPPYNISDAWWWNQSLKMDDKDFFSLASLNDDGMSFADIADRLEQLDFYDDSVEVAAELEREREINERHANGEGTELSEPSAADILFPFGPA